LVGDEPSDVGGPGGWKPRLEKHEAGLRRLSLTPRRISRRTPEGSISGESIYCWDSTAWPK
jgi:hypothetical protein